MSYKINLTGLNNFKKRLQSLNMQAFANKVLIALSKVAVSKANEEYAKTNANVSVNYEINGNVASITANSKYVAFLEYGTGEYARGTYEGNLPQTGVPITGGWEYYYLSDSKDEVDGQKGWWFAGTFMTGNEAQAQMWKTARYIEKNASAIINEVLGANK